MKPSEIKVGGVYVNRGKGNTKRTVISIGESPGNVTWHGLFGPPNEPVVTFEQSGKTRYLYLSSFASWAGHEVPREERNHDVGDLTEAGAAD